MLAGGASKAPPAAACRHPGVAPGRRGVADRGDPPGGRPPGACPHHRPDPRGVPIVTEFPTAFPAARRPGPLGPRAARALAAELARHAGPKTGLVIAPGTGRAPDAVLAAAIDALLPDDRLTVVAEDPA